ncbi:unnamed protein product [Phaeothamnion confervicola]
MAQLEATAAAAPSAKAGMAPLTQQEMCEIVTEYADPGARSDRGAQVLYDDFVDALVAAGPRSATDRSAGNGGRGVPPLRRASSLDPAATVLSWGELKVPESPVRRQRHQPPPTVGTYLRDMNQQVYTQHGDLDKQLGRAMTAFSSCFARTGRRKLLRKHFLAFDIHNIGKVNREHFLETVDEVAAEVRVDFDQRDRILLADFFFVKEHGQVDYETLLEILFARDVLRAHAFRKRTLENASDYEELFTAVDNAARKRDFGGTLNLFAANRQSCTHYREASATLLLLCTAATAAVWEPPKRQRHRCGGSCFAVLSSAGGRSERQFWRGLFT